MNPNQDQKSTDTIQVLHLDDEQNLLLIATRMMTSLDPRLHIESTTSPHEALEMIKKNEYGCIVSDYRMPAIDGIELAQRIREVSNVPIILYTGQGSEEVAERAFEVGIDDYLRKEMEPAHYQVLVKRIRAAVEKYNVESDLMDFKLGIDKSDEAIFVVDLEGVIKYVNPAFEKIYGFSSREAVGKTPRILKSGVVPQEIYDQFWDTLLAKQIVSGEIINKTKDGRLLTMFSSANPILNKGGKITGFLTIQRDITDRKRIEDEIRKFKTISDNAGYGSAITDLKGNLVYVNKSFAEMHGYTADELVGEHLSILHTKEQLSQVSRLMEQLIQKGNYVAEEVWHKRRDGTIFSTLMNGTLIRDEEGRPLSMGATAIDITERKKIEEELQWSEEYYRTLLESGMAGVTVVSDDKFVYVNKRFAEMLGYNEPQELFGVNTIDIIHSSSKDFLLERKRIRREGNIEPVRYEIEVLRKDGSGVSLEVLSSIIDYKGKPSTLAFARDLTERIQFEKRLEALHRHAVELALVESLEDIGETTLRVIKSVFGFQWIDFNVIKGDRLVPLLIQDDDLKSNMELPLRGPGIITRAYRTGVSQLVHDTRLDEDYMIGRDKGSEEWLSELAVPAKIRGHVLAVINIEDKKLGAFTPIDQKLLEIFGEHVASAIDRLERKSALRFSEEKFRSLLEELSDAVFVLDREKYLYVNQFAAELLGFSDPGELIGRDAYEFIAPEDKEKVRDYSQRRQRGEEVPSRYEFNLVNKEGSKIPVEVNVSLIEFEGKPASLAINRDITERKRIEERLHESELMYREMAENSLDLIYRVDLKGNITYASPAIEAITGYRPDELVGKSFFKLLPKRNLPKIVSLMQKSVGGGDHIQRFQSSILRKDGSRVAVETNSSRILVQGKMVGFQGIIREVSERTQMMETLQESEERWRALIELAPDGIITVDLRGFVTMINDAFIKLTGFSREEIVGKHFTRLGTLRVRDIPIYVKLFASLIKGEIPPRFDFVFNRKDGSEGWAEGQFRLIAMGKKKKELLAVVRDVSERQKMEEAAIQYQKRLEALHQSAFRLAKHNNFYDIIVETLEIIKDALGFQYLGIAQIIGDEIVFVDSVGAYQTSDFRIPLNTPSVVGCVFKTGKSRLISDTRLDPDYYIDPELGASVQRLSELAVPVLVGGEVFAVIDVEGVDVDMFTEDDFKLLEILAGHVSSSIERLRYIDDLRSLDEEHALALVEGVQRVSSMVRHDLRGPMQTIMNAIYLMETNPETIAEMRTLINSSIKNANDIMEDWKNQGITEQLTQSDTDIQTLIENALETSLLPSNVKVSQNIESSIIHLDRIKTRRVLDNLIRNAVEAMPEGGALSFEGRVNGDVYVLEVKDTGAGISEKGLSKLFTPFYTTKQNGMGLGLAFCKWTVEAHAGSIEVESEEGEGTKFTISIPRASM